MKEAGYGGSFLEKLWEILAEPANHPYICWQPSGLSFVIHDVQDFETYVLTKYFKHSNHNSFVRQLNMYSFVKTCNDSNYREFQNPFFQRARRDLMINIKRKASAPGASKDILQPKKVTEGMTQRQRAMIAQQQADEEAAERAKLRAEVHKTTTKQKETGLTNLMLPSPGLNGNSVTWDKENRDGGAIYLNQRSGSISLTGCTFSDNSAGFIAGAIWVGESAATLTDCTFSGNSAVSGCWHEWHVHVDSWIDT